MDASEKFVDKYTNKHNLKTSVYLLTTTLQSDINYLLNVYILLNGGVKIKCHQNENFISKYPALTAVKTV